MTRTRRTGSLFLSLLLHGLAVGLLIFLDRARPARNVPSASTSVFQALPSSEPASLAPDMPSVPLRTAPVPPEASRAVPEALDRTMVDQPGPHPIAPTEAKPGELPSRVDVTPPPVADLDVSRTASVVAPAAPQAKREVEQAPAVGLQPVASDATEQTWEGRVLARLNQHKRYPPPARASGQEGTAYIRLVVDRCGRLADVTLSQGSGHPLLDREAVALARRASPFPPPPDTSNGAPIVRIIPIDFYIRARR